MREIGYSGRGGAFWEVLGWRFIGRGDSFFGGKSGPETRGRQGDIFSGGVLRVKLEKNILLFSKENILLFPVLFFIFSWILLDYIWLIKNTSKIMFIFLYFSSLQFFPYIFRK